MFSPYSISGGNNRHDVSRWTPVGRLGAAIFLALQLFETARTEADDWPMWRYDAQRSCTTAEPLGTDLRLQWSRELPPSQPAWPATQQGLQFDVAPHPVVLDTTIFVNSTTHDSLTAYDTRTGRERWNFCANGPIRFAPVANDGKVYFIADDGYLYCLAVDDGRLLWKVNGGPAERWVLGNERLISMWPARGGPVLHDGKIYFTASIWPFMGIFVHAVDSNTGMPVWTNSGDGTNMTVQPHGAPSFATVAPQGHLAISDKNLIVPGGRSVPAVYSTETGELKHFEYDKKRGGNFAFAAGAHYFVGGASFDSESGSFQIDETPAISDGDVLLFAENDRILGKDVGVQIRERKVTDRKGQETTEKQVLRRTLFERRTTEPVGRILMKTGTVVWTASGRKVMAFDLANPSSQLEPVWAHQLDGEVWEALAADSRLFVVTTDSRLLCFGPGKQRVMRYTQPQAPLASNSPWDQRVQALFRDGQAPTGYALAIGIGSGQLIDALLSHTRLFVIVIDPDASKVRALRQRLRAAQLYGQRVAALVGNPYRMSLPPYFASSIISEQAELPQTLDDVKHVYEYLRPYGGCAYLPLLDQQHGQLSAMVKRADLYGAQVERLSRWSKLSRQGALPDAGDWTHQYANAAQTGISSERRVKTPLGLLWFGGPSHEGILPRHGHGPSPQVAAGRLLIEGPDLLRALDIYTGRLLWDKELKGLGHYYDITGHFPGAGEIGSNYVSLSDRVYVVYGPAILELDAATGQTLRKFELDSAARDNAANWGFLAVSDDLLIATSSPVAVTTTDQSGQKGKEPVFEADERPIIAPHANWRYLAGSDPPAGWTAIGFDDSSWKQGPAGFGYGDDDDETVLKDMQSRRYTRVYLRTKFSGKLLAGARNLVLYVNYDDGFIAYLNGQEICRSSIASGSGAGAKVKSHEADAFEYFPIKDWAKLLIPGENVLAVEGHNVSSTSSDFSLDPYVLAKVARRTNEGDGSDIAAEPAPALQDVLQPTRYASGSRRLVVMDRHTGRQLWHRDAEYNFRHNNIAVGAGKIFCIDRLSDMKWSRLQRRGIKAKERGTLYALDAHTGRVAWSTQDDVFGTFLSYSAEYDALVQAGSQYRDRAIDEVGKGMVVYRGRDGRVKWKDLQLDYNGPCLLWRDRIITNGNGGFAVDINTGQRTGWSYGRAYGCNTAIGCENLLTFRSGAAGYYDLAGDSGTGNLGGFRSSCTSNLIPAGGVLNAPDYTRTCTCAYQNQTSLALIHMPEAEYWTYGGYARAGSIGINLGAPGDRRAPNGTLWVDCPSVGGKSPKVQVSLQPDDCRVFRHHSSRLHGDLNWVAGSGLEGLRRITIRVDSPAEHLIRLVFLEPTSATAGRRVFDVSLQQEIVLRDFQIASEAGGPLGSIIKEFHATPVGGEIIVDLAQKSDLPTVISGIELIGKSNE